MILAGRKCCLTFVPSEKKVGKKLHSGTKPSITRSNSNPMTKIFHDCFQSKKYLLLAIFALLQIAQNRLVAQNCDTIYTPPVLACDEFTTVALGTDDANDCYGLAGPNNQPEAFGPYLGTGTTWVKAVTFDDGSYDGCGANIHFTVRRMAPYTNMVLNLNTTNGHAPCNDLFPDFPSEFERAISEYDSIKFYAGEVGTSQIIAIRAYKLASNGSILVNPATGQPVFGECLTTVEIQDKLKPVCVAPADVTVTCEQFDPSFAAYGLPVVTDNACLDTVITLVNYANFDSLCNKGTITRIFKAFDCSGNTSQCTQKIVVNYSQNYYVRFPNDVLASSVSPNGLYGEPTIFGEDCELLGFSYEDQVFVNQPDASVRLDRTWTIINWCTYDPNLPITVVPNPNPNAVNNHPTNLPGPTLSAPGTVAPWSPTIVKITPTDPTPTDYSTFWDQNANGYRYLQVIKIIDTFFVAVQGTVFSDTSANCAYETGEALLGGWTVKVTGLTTGTEKTILTDANGGYSVVMNGIDTVMNVTLVSSGNFGQGCQTNYTVNGIVGQSVTQNIPVHLEERCALLSVGISAPSLRRCFNSRYTAEACNLSGQSVSDAYVDVDLDPYLTYTGSSIPGMLVSGNTYRFQVGTLAPGDCKRFWINVDVQCAAPFGATHCTNASIHPYVDCRGDNSSWTGADVDVSATCDGDSVRLKIANIGDGPMAQSLDFVVVEDIIMRQSGSFQLGIGEELDWAYPADGSTWRLEASEEPLHPFGGQQAVALEGCGGLNTTGLVNMFPLSDANPFETIDCQQNIGSFDPNDKQAFPVGYGSAHYLKQNTDIEYMIRFQNTGTDTAFTVRVLDTLSQYLDPASVRVLTTSHPVAFSILEGGVLEFLFDNIMLPDSNVNTPESNGFLKFRVSQIADVQEDTKIENQAAIYFDFNDPVLTNTTFHTINSHFLTVGVNDPKGLGAGLKVYPNPTADVAIFDFEKPVNNARFDLTNQMGQLVRQEKFSGNQFRFERLNLQPGMYFFQVTGDNGALYTGKILVH